MRYVIYLLALISANISVANPKMSRANPCPELLWAVPFSVVRDAMIATEVTAADVEAAEEFLWQRLVRLVASLPEPGQPLPRDLEPFLEATKNLSAVASGAMRGLDARVQPYAERAIHLLETALGRRLDGRGLIQRVRRISLNPALQVPFTMQSFIAKGQPSVEYVFLHLAQQLDLLGLPPPLAGFQHLDLIKLVLQFAQTTTGDRILEIGSGRAIDALALQSFIRRPTTLVDPTPISNGSRALLAANGITHVDGIFPESRVLEALNRGEKFQTIYALDVFRSGTFIQPESASHVLKSLRDLLNPSGTVIILNDHATQPIFSRAQAEQYGFEIVRWNSPRFVDPHWLRIMPYVPGTNGGQLRAFVLRKCGDPGARVEITEVVQRN